MYDDSKLFAASFLLISLTAAGLAGCGNEGDVWRDLNADRDFVSIHTSGFTSVSADGAVEDVIASCEGVGVSGDTAGDMKLRFVLTDNDARPIRIGDGVGGQVVELAQDSVSFGNSALTEVSLDKGCENDADCSGDGFACGTPPGLTSDEPDLDACFRADEGLAVDSSVDFVADTHYHQVYGLLVQNSGSLSGFNPPGAGDKAWDSDGDGITDTRPNNGKIRDIASDPDDRRKSSVLSVFRPWRNTATLAQSEDDRRTYFGLWTFAGTGPNTVGDDNNEVDWVRDPEQVEARLNAYAQSTAHESRANVYETIQQVIDTKFNTDTLAEYVGDAGQPEKIEKVLTVFVDGPNELRNVSADIEDVVQTAREHNVRIFIVHLDARIEAPGELRDDPIYHEGQQTNCSDDSECKNYETCRRPRGYGNSIDTGEPTGFEDSDTYCMINRDGESGRIGPIEEYALLACATGGGYMYAPSAEAIWHNMEWTPYALEGLWETTVHSAELSRGNAPAGEPLLVHGDMSIEVSGTSRVYPFNQLGQSPSSSDTPSKDFDTRSAIFSTTE